MYKNITMLYSLLALSWLINGINTGKIIYYVLAAMWLALAAVSWTGKKPKNKRTDSSETEEGKDDLNDS